MPSPIGHSLIGAALAVACLLPDGKPGGLRNQLWRNRWLLAGCVVIANMPDLDFLPGLLVGDLNAFHHGYSHSLGWVLLVVLGLWSLAKSFGARAGSAMPVLLLLVMGSHLVADYLCEDGAPPFGIMLFWPFQDTWYVSRFDVFAAMDKATLAEVFTRANLPAAMRELVIGGVLCVLAVVGINWKRRCSSEA